MRPVAGALPILLLWAVPLLLSLLALLPPALDPAAWRMVFGHPQFPSALLLSLFTGTVSSLLALGMALAIIGGAYRTHIWARLTTAAAASLAIPHLAFAIGFGFLVMPSGLVARLIVGGDVPPGWISVQDPFGVSLSLALALKEVPFLLTAAFASLSRGDAARRLAMECRAGASLGHGPGSCFLRIVMPQLLDSLRWPLVIVFVYGATVVDMALVLGPTQPPSFAVVIWHALNHASPEVNRMGLAATLFLTLVLGLVLAGAAALTQAMRSGRQRFYAAGPSPLAAPRRTALLLGGLVLGLILLAVLMLAMLSVAQRWPYPALLPEMGPAAWETLGTAPQPLWLSLLLSLAVSAAAVALAIGWFESQPAGRDRWMTGLALLTLALPQLATAGGQYRLFLDWGLTGRLSGLFLAHLTPALAYVMIVLQGPYRSFDMRYIKAAQGLSASAARRLFSVKLPLLKAPVMVAAAIGFAVSIAQFVPAQLIAAGRWSTLPMEAVTLASGGNRPLAAAYALALALPPLLGFLLAAKLARPRWG